VGHWLIVAGGPDSATVPIELPSLAWMVSEMRSIAKVIDHYMGQMQQAETERERKRYVVAIRMQVSQFAWYARMVAGRSGLDWDDFRLEPASEEEPPR
jgi:hypothetical protein